MSGLPPRSVVCVAPVLPADVRNYARAIAEVGWLRSLVCGGAYHHDSAVGQGIRAIDRVAGTRLAARSANRRVSEEVNAASLVADPFPEIWSGLAVRSGLRRSSVETSDAQLDRLDHFAAHLIRSGDRIAIGREDCCERTFTAARRLGVVTVYDLPTAHHITAHRIREEESAEFPGVEINSGSSQPYTLRRRLRKHRELVASDHVVMPSEFVRQSLFAAGIDRSRVTAIPFGCEPGRAFVPYTSRKSVVLYVGRLSLPKGIPRLLRVWKKLGAYRTHTLRLIGRMMLTPKFLADYAGMYEHVPQVPRSDLWTHYAAAQVFVFPSACDGFGLVLNEALSCGTPVIASSHTGAPGFVTHGAEGLIYPHGDDDQLAAEVEKCLSNPGETVEMGRRAYDLAQRWGWPEYRAAFRGMVTALVAKS